jgi:hypothetical protein
VILGGKREALLRRAALDIAEPSPFRGGTAGAAVECGGCTRWIRYSEAAEGSMRIEWGMFLNGTCEFRAWRIYGSGLRGCSNAARKVRHNECKGNCEGLPQSS